ncbi:MAG TPA: PEP-CTERM sorting domain-containing protein, partial [Terriglobales bacterium]|nr:PEP-CTERM sorting domain-containing protein [Terriglobales bacterium]
GSAIIQGGTLNNNSGAFFGTPSGNTAFLDGSTGAGAITINGTYTSDLNTNTYFLGTINNHGNIQVNGGAGTNTLLSIDSNNVTLQGGGTVALNTVAGGGNAFILQAAGGLTLTNFDNTIQGTGIIGENGLTLVNQAAGTLLANAFGQTLFVNGGGVVTNNGTFQADAGSSLHLQNVTFTNFSANTLTGGTYNIFGTFANPGTLQIDYLGNTGGEIINNAATILLDGPNSNLVDAAGLDALANFSNNTASGSFTIRNGRNFTSPGDFSNAGAVQVGSGSTLATGGTGNYNQSTGSTRIDGTLVAGGGNANIKGGTLLGNGGTIVGNVTMSGTISPGDNVLTAGALAITGNYTQTSTGVFDLGIGGLLAGTQFDLLTVNGQGFLDGTLDVSLENGFFPALGDTFTFLVVNPGVFGLFATTNGLNIGNGEVLVLVYNPGNVELVTESTTQVPEPTTLLLLGSGLAALLGCGSRGKKR